MKTKMRLLATAAVLLLAAIAPAQSQMAPTQRAEIEKIVREYLIAHPEVLQEAMMELEKKSAAMEAEKHLFAYSVFYLFALFAVLVADRYLPW